MGPFVDSQHPIIKTGQNEASIQEIFQEKVEGFFKKALESPIQLVVMSATADAGEMYDMGYIGLPQPAMNAKSVPGFEVQNRNT